MKKRGKWAALLLLTIALLPVIAMLNHRRLNGLLRDAAANADLQAVTSLLAKGAEPNSTDGFGDTPLHKFVLNSDNLRYDAKRGAIVKVLIAHGADINAAERDGETALHYAITPMNDADDVQTLVQAGADVNARSRRFGAPLSQALTALEEERKAKSVSVRALSRIVSILRQHNAKTNAQLSTRRAPAPQP